MFRCKNKYGVRQEVTWTWIKEGWLAAITVCNAELFTPDFGVFEVEDFEITSWGDEVTLTWRPRVRNLMALEYRLNEEEDWTAVDPVRGNLGEF